MGADFSDDGANTGVGAVVGTGQAAGEKQIGERRMRAFGRVMLLVAMVGLPGCCTIRQWMDGGTCAAPAPAAESGGNAAPSDTTRGLRVGDRIPDAVLATAEGRDVSLRDAAAGRAVVLAFYRGGWCPYCSGELREWQGRLGELHELGAELIAITPEAPGFVSQTQIKNELEFMVLSDVMGEAAERFDLGFAVDGKTQRKYEGYGIDLAAINARKTWELVIPATYVVDAEGVIRYAYVNEDYTERADADEVLAAVRGLE